MKIEVAQQTMLFLQSCLLGIVLGFVYDIFRILRLALKSGVVVIFIEDILFWSMSAVVTFLFMLTENSGQLRVFVLLGECIGAVVYYLTVGALIMKISKAIIEAVKKLLHILYRIFIYPFVRLGGAICRRVAKIYKKTRINNKKVQNNVKFSLKHHHILLYNLMSGNKQKARKNSELK